MADLVLRGGHVVDGGGGDPVRADVLLRGAEIAAVGEVAPPPTAEVIDVTGLLVLPGFVDAHSHADGQLSDVEVASALLRQGVTTVVVGQDGVSYAPSTDQTAADLERYFSAVNGPRPAALPGSCSVGDLLDRYDTGTYVNAAVLVPAGNVRAAVVGFDPRAATPVEIERMRALVAAGLDDGAVGMSTGLEYVPGGFADLAELVALCEVVANAGAVHVSHMRGYEGDAPTGMAELRTIAARSGVPTHISHLHGPAAVIEPLLQDAFDAGCDITFDTYPYLRGSTLLAMLTLPASLQAGRPADTVATLRNPVERAELARSWFPRIADLLSRVTLSYVAAEGWGWAEGRRLTDVADRVGLPVGDLVCRLLVDADLGVGCLVQQPSDNTEHDLSRLLRHPAHMVGSDGIFMGSRPHPRARGAIARFLARHVVQLGDWSWGEAAQHLSTNAVDRFGLGPRGRVLPGRIADLAVVDPTALADRATYDEPLALATGVELVLIGGRVVLRDGGVVGGPAGRSIRREKV
ncbi:N-acyl-D-amino-acid deacylase [Micromonospora viridifaciens]|uniref:N-acyl-D-amino-acid deacylase n=1 Tax=Micromonospora viridifaciens TaxID=1881 RepID=A0A1C4WSR2_MICVI|nr:amidohydrolase family protein [Micromonospora viridifaciens]SCE99214.1 N-acyl-D-amino-acid deacylase [Micromonospora viridifaciens]